MARVLSGIQPSGDLHLGNYIGAIRQFVLDQERFDCFFCVVDLHAITTPQDPAALRDATLDLCATYLAAGVDPEKATLFLQSHVPEHTQLSWAIGAAATQFGELRRMTQFKDKSGGRDDAAVGFGLFAYPVLMAADILVYQADRVPIGDDQKQHLELTRDIAQRFNARFGETFVVPKPAIPEVGGRVMDLQNPENKMSKSANSPSGTLKMMDPPDVMRKKIKSAVTDSGREVKVAEDKPAVTNLLEIYSVLTGRTIADLEQAYAGKGYGDFKGDLADAVIAHFEPIQARYNTFAADPGELLRLLEIGAQKAQSIASKTVADVYEKIGFVARGR